MEHGFLSQKGSKGRRGVKEKNKVVAAKDVVSPSMIKEPVVNEEQSSLVDTSIPNVEKTGLSSYPPLPTHGSTPTGNNHGMSLYANVTYENLLKEDVSTVSVWVKLYGIPVTAFSEDILSVIATKLGTPLMLDSYTFDMCMQSWGRSSYARAMIELRADVELKDKIVEAMPKITGEGYYTCAGETKNLKKPSQTPKGFMVGQKIGFKPKQVYQPVLKKHTTNTSGKKNKNVEPTAEVSKSNPFDVLTSVENDVELGTNGETTNLAGQEANFSGSSFWNVNSSNPSTTSVIEKIDKIEKLIIDEKVTLVDDEGKPLEKVAYSGDYDSEDEADSVGNEMASFLAKKDGYGTLSLLEQ
uniref:Uncharacterized protein n=1 Tax=Tanacetum cinerariifolium TaxID=118510 RepID=A0A6L2L798_TANCI|nr:hypothetical protein [Tanacetum cinerariifolium]